ncbi:MAG: hypothetical protein ACPG7F_21305 [Aggregatilineales bacterium]
MADKNIQAYLSASLDRAACKPTLTAALHSRITALQHDGVSNLEIINCLEHLSEDPFQMNDDIIHETIAFMLN